MKDLNTQTESRMNQPDAKKVNIDAGRLIEHTRSQRNAAMDENASLRAILNAYETEIQALRDRVAELEKPQRPA